MPYPRAIIFDMDGTLIDKMLYHKQSSKYIQTLSIKPRLKVFDKRYHKFLLVEIIVRLFPISKN